MLYEVITNQRIFDLQSKNKVLTSEISTNESHMESLVERISIMEDVITSYSIHYTKLYDLFLDCKSKILWFSWVFILIADEILDFKLEKFSSAETNDFSEKERRSEWFWIEFSIFSIVFFFFKMYFFKRLIDCKRPSIDELKEIIFVSLDILELISSYNFV